MSSIKQKITKKSDSNKRIIENAIKMKEESAAITENMLKMTPHIKTIISSFVKSLLDINENNNVNLNKSFSPQINKVNTKLDVKEDAPIRIKQDQKEAKELDINLTSQKNRYKSTGKIKKNLNSTHKKPNLNIVVNSNNKLKNKSSLNISINKSKKNNINYRRMIQTENNFKTPCNRETIGDKLIREEIAKEKKICAEKMRIIKDHILSLQKKEEELLKKMLKLKYQENILTRKKMENGKESVLPKPQNTMNKKDELRHIDNKNNNQLKINQDKNEFNNTGFNEKEKKDKDKNDGKEKNNMINSSEKEENKKEKEKKNEIEKKENKGKLNEKSPKKPLEKNKTNENKDNKIDKNKYKNEKTPEKMQKMNKSGASNSHSKRKIVYRIKQINNSNSIELTKKNKSKDNKK